MKSKDYDERVQTPDAIPEEESNLLVEIDVLANDSSEVLMSDEKISAIASGLVSNSTEINEYIQDNDEFYQEYIKNPDRELKVPTDPMRVFDL